MSEPDRLRAGQMFGKYQIVRLIGEGGMGAVYEALHPILKKRFAIKVLLPSTAETPEIRTRFLREGEAASRISHPNVVVVSDVGTEGDTPYLVMEYFEGETLADLMAKRRRLEVSEAVDLLLPVISAVVAGHDNGVVHRDLKPQNVFLARGHWGESIPKVLDFGVSKLISGERSTALTGTLTVLGTAAYMSPEQARGSRDVDGRSDQYALGLVLYEMLTAVRAHPGDSLFEVLQNIATGNLVRPRQARPDLPEDLLAAMERMLALAPADRFPTLRAVGRALFPFASERARAGIPDAFWEPTDAMEPRSASAPPLGRTLSMPEPPPPARPNIPAARPPVAAAPPQIAPARPQMGETLMLPQPGRQPDTTFSRSAAELRARDLAPQRSGLARWILAVLGVVATAGLVFVLTTKPWTASDVPRATFTAPAPLERTEAPRPKVSSPRVVRDEPSTDTLEKEDDPPKQVRLPPPPTSSAKSAHRSHGSSQRRKIKPGSRATAKRDPAPPPSATSSPASPKAGVPAAPILD